MISYSIEDGSGNYIELSAPLKIYYDITNRCNLNCVFCFKRKSEYEVTWEQAKAIIQKVADANIPDMVFIGGEPFCCPFLFDALRFAKESGINPGIVTNGTFFNDKNAPLLKELVNNSISVSVHAPNDELHDKLSNGTGVYTRILLGLKTLNKYGINPEISFTPVKDNIHFLYDTIDGIISEGIKISDVLVNRLIPFGNALKNWEMKEVDLDDQITLLGQMERLHQKYPYLPISSGDAIPFCVVEEKYRKFIARCDYAITLGWINDHNLFGKCMVRGCTSADSLDKHDLREVWATSASFLSHRCMNNLPDECKDCEWLMECGGGCACSGQGTTDKDAYLSVGRRYPMPAHETKSVSELTASCEEKIAIQNDTVFTIEKHFLIRKEREAHSYLDCNYLFLPPASGAVIQDIITPQNGKMIWVNEPEKQVIIYLQTGLKVSDIAKSISYEFSLSRENALSLVKDTIAILFRLGMVTTNEQY